MRHGLTRGALRWLVPILGMTLAVAAHAQSSTNFKMIAGIGSAGGAFSSASFAMIGETGVPAPGRNSGNTNDIIAGFIGAAFSSQATINLATTAETYSAVAFPLTLSNTAVTSVLASLGSADRTKWRFGHWSPVDSAYMETGASTLPLNNIARGQGYWLITKAAQSINATGLPAPTVPSTIIALLSGPGTPARPAWNMLGNPYLYPIPLNLMVVDDGVTNVIVNAVGNLLTSQVIKVRSGSSYVDATVVNGRTAFWIKKLVPQAVNLFIRPVPSATGSPEPSRQKPVGATWAVAINGLQDGRASETLWLGAAPLADRGWNALSVSRGPNPPEGEDLSLAVRKHDWREMNDDYVRLFEPAAARMSWDVTLSGATGPGEVALAIEGFELPAGLHLYLTDPIAGWTREVEPGQSVRVAVGTGPKVIRFEAAAASVPVSTTPLADGFRIAYPNPFRATTGLSFTLARPGAIAVEIFDLQGRLVRSLERPRAGVGEQVLVWDGLDQGGSVAGSGVYLTRWRAGDVQGTARLVRIE